MVPAPTDDPSDDVSDVDAVTRRWDDGTVGLQSLLDLERIEQDLFRANTVYVDMHDERTGRMRSLYGGQVAAQALVAAGRTVAEGRVPHSLHGYFLRPGDARRPTVFNVYRDRDGRTFSARRVVAIQQGKVIFNMSASFTVPSDAELDQVESAPVTSAPDTLAADLDMFPLFAIECRVPSAPYGARADWPTRFWARATETLPPDPLLQAGVLTYLSDVSSGVLGSPDGHTHPSSSLDHAVWFHGPIDMNEWVLSDYTPRVTGHGRGWYTGSLFTPDGRLVASLAQETLFR